MSFLIRPASIPWHTSCTFGAQVQEGVMGSKDTEKRERKGSQENLQLPKSPLDLWRMMGGQAERVRSKEGRSVDSMLAVYRDRLTYTFIMGHEVASIHFDRAKGEIFFRGHNIRHDELGAEKIKALEAVKSVLAQEERAKPFLAEYEATLASSLAENKNRGTASK